MIITVTSVDPPTLEVEFTPTEKGHELFEDTTTAVSEQVDLTEKPQPPIRLDPITVEPEILPDTEPLEEPAEPLTTLIITKPVEEGMDNMVALGRLVDEVREQYCGDVVYTYTEEEIEVTPAVIDPETEEIITPAVVENRQVQEEKDLSNCPCFSIGPPPTEAEPAEEPLVVEPPAEDESELHRPQ